MDLTEKANQFLMDVILFKLLYATQQVLSATDTNELSEAVVTLEYVTEELKGIIDNQGDLK